MASKSSISNMTRLLMQHGQIERFVKPGVRHDFFRLSPKAFRHTIHRGLEDEIRMFRELAEYGLDVLPKKESAPRNLMLEMHTMFSFLEKEFPGLMERYETWQKKTGRKPIHHHGGQQ